MYKLSDYNYFIKHEGRTVCFNSISGQIFSVSEQEYAFLQEQFMDLISFELHYNSIFNRFADWGFIAQEDEDQLDVIRLLNRKRVFLDRMYRLVINPTLECNFKCWYCYEDHVKGSMSDEVMGRVKRHLKYMVEEEKITGLLLDWFGGEPLLYFDEVMVPIAQYARELAKEYKIPFTHQITTNASLISKERVGKMKELELDHFQITLDGDEKRHDKIRNINGLPSFRKIYENVQLLCEYIPDVHITLRINYDDQTLKKSDMKQVFEGIPVAYRKLITPNFQQVWQLGKATNGKENEQRIELFNYCKDLGYDVQNPTNFLSLLKGYTCYVDRYYHTEINYDGKIYKCTARAYSDDYVLGELKDDGRIRWNQKKLGKMYRKATFENEMCLACKHVPLCTGPCGQKMLETPEGEIGKLCYLNTAEVGVETFILSLYEDKMQMLKSQQEVL